MALATRFVFATQMQRKCFICLFGDYFQTKVQRMVLDPLLLGPMQLTKKLLWEHRVLPINTASDRLLSIKTMSCGLFGKIHLEIKNVIGP